MKICMLTTGHTALDDRIFYKEALSLGKKYNDIYVVAPDEKKNYVVNGINIIGTRIPKSLKDRFRVAKEVVDEAIKVKADVYHFHDYELIFYVLKIKKSLPKAKIVYDVHEHYPDMIRMSRKLPKLLKPFGIFCVDKSEAFFSKKFDYIITADDAVKERFDAFNKNVDVIYNFSEFEFNDIEPCEKVYDVIYQGGITLERGVFNVVKAIDYVRKSKKDIKMVFVGPFNDTKGKEKVFNYIQENKLQNNISFVGKVPHEEVEKYIRSSKIGVVTLLPLPKYFKNIPIKQFEYMSCGIPVIGSNLPPIQKFVSKYNSGIIVDPTKPEEIGKAIIKILDDDDLRYKLGQNGIKAVKEEYNWTNMEKKIVDVYKKIED